jgi:hypothetical protein
MMKPQKPRDTTRAHDPFDEDIEPTVEIQELALVDATQDHKGYNPYDARSLTPASREPPKIDAWVSKRKRS